MSIESVNAALPPGASVAPARRVSAASVDAREQQPVSVEKKGDDAPVERQTAPADAERSFQRLSEAARKFDISLKFSRDEETGSIVMEMVDQKSGETVRQIPSELSLHLTAVFGKAHGNVFDRHA